MERLRELNHYQKAILILMTAMTIIFTVIYVVTISRVGFEFKDTIFIPSKENGNTLYSAKLFGKQASFTVSEDKSVLFKSGNKSYGPYIAKEDASAIPKEEGLPDFTTGVELLKDDEVIFRGGILETDDSYTLYNEDGSLEGFGISYTTYDGITYHNGKIIDPLEPSARTILELMGEPELSHKGSGLPWFLAVSICIINAISIIFADELFRWILAFSIKYAYEAEPTDWEIAGRYISWTLLPIFALVVFIIGLN